MTLRQLYEEGKTQLSLAGVEDAALDARLLLCEAFCLTPAEYLLSCERPLAGLYPEARCAEHTECYRRFLSERGRRVPLQQILGKTEFMGLPFLVNGQVLTPRQDTETLAETVLSAHPEEELCVLDLCTGSGCIAISLAALGRYRTVVAADLSREALLMAEENAKRILGAEAVLRAPAEADGAPAGLPGEAKSCEIVSKKNREKRLIVLQSDLFAAFPEAGTEENGFAGFDVIVSNPPYIPSAEIETLDPEVRDFEPRMALDGSADGLCFYRRIAGEAGAYLRAGGSLYLEIGADQAEAVSALLSENGWGKIRVIQDLSGHDRVVCAARGAGPGAEEKQTQPGA